MRDIQEIPLDIPDTAKELGNNSEDIPPPVEDIAEIPLPEEVKPIKPKAKGRPKGSLNKGHPKPRAKKAAQAQETPIEEPAYEPSSPKRNLKIPTDPSTSDVAAAMLKLLQDQSYSRLTRKQRLYISSAPFFVVFVLFFNFSAD